MRWPWSGDAQAHIYRHDGLSWRQLTGGLPSPLSHMPYVLLTDPEAPGFILAGLSNGDLWHSLDHGDSWSRLQVSVGPVRRGLVMI